MPSLLRIATTLLIATPLSAQVRLFMAPEGTETTVATTGPTTMGMEAGSTKRVMVWLEDLDQAQVLNSYQVLVRWTGAPDSGASGTVSYLDDGIPFGGGSVLIDYMRPDWVFAGYDIVYPFVDEQEGSWFSMVAGHQELSQGSIVDGLTYVGECDIRVSDQAHGVHRFWFIPQGGSDFPGTRFILPGGLGPYLVHEYQDLQVVITHCGDGLLEPNEQCDDGNAIDDDGCDSMCRAEGACCFEGGACEPFVSDTECSDLGGVFQGGGTSCADIACRFCGNGLVEPTEPCDDGNIVSNDGCSSSCDVEPGFECNGEPSLCLAAVPAVSGWGMVVLVVCILISVVLVARHTQEGLGKPEQKRIR
jgi:cysteine-rich repeat protein